MLTVCDLVYLSAVWFSWDTVWLHLWSLYSAQSARDDDDNDDSDDEGVKACGENHNETPSRDVKIVMQDIKTRPLKNPIILIIPHLY